MLRRDAKSSQKPPKKRGLYTPEPVRERVVERRVRGESKRQIARVERIDRETVDRILSREEVVRMMAQYYSRLLEMVPKAVRVFEKVLDGDDVRVALGAATKLMEAMHQLHKVGIEQAIQAANQKRSEEKKEDMFLEFGGLSEVIWDQWCRRGEPLPHGYEWMKKLKESEIAETESDGGPGDDSQDSMN